MPAGLGWDTLIVDHGRHRASGVMRSPFPAPFMIGGPRDALGGTFAPPPSKLLEDYIAFEGNVP
jgi:hypothetical protein